MNVRTMLRTTAAAVAIGVMVLGSPAGLSLAAPKDAERSCKARGYFWDATLGCADKQCEANGRTYKGNEIITRRSPVGDKFVMLVCDGFTGKWIGM